MAWGTAVISSTIVVIDRVTEITGRAISWLTMLMVALVVAVVVMRYFLEMGSIAMQESITYIHAMVFMMGIAFTLKRGGHVRVDIFYRTFSVRKKALVDLLGGVLFLIPVALLILATSWDYVAASWAIAETSAENNGLPFIYLLKTLMLIMPFTLLLQGIAEILKSALTLAGQTKNQHEAVEPIL
ncbi:TRAP transporter small permease subunit [Porticoccaceae bacterium]|nr:TRAP transporter small permease subunit [Porticoccaceae bacterium]